MLPKLNITPKNLQSAKSYWREPCRHIWIVNVRQFSGGGNGGSPSRKCSISPQVILRYALFSKHVLLIQRASIFVRNFRKNLLFYQNISDKDLFAESYRNNAREWKQQRTKSENSNNKHTQPFTGRSFTWLWLRRCSAYTLRLCKKLQCEFVIQ